MEQFTDKNYHILNEFIYCIADFIGSIIWNKLVGRAEREYSHAVGVALWL